jgi:cysteine desulfurase
MEIGIMPTRPVYLDNQATTPVDPAVLAAMLPYFGPRFGNAASRSHLYGWEAEQAVEHARKQIAALAFADPREVVFTSGATESNNLAIKGVVPDPPAGAHAITVATEHKSVLDPFRRLEKKGLRLTVLMPGPDGAINPDWVRSAICPETVLVSVMWANSEIGVIQPIREIGFVCREMNVRFHCDAVQAFGKVAVDAADLDLISVSAHKLYGPKGIGALLVRRNGKPKLQPQMDGGGHEFGLRSGTLNVPAIVGFGEACAIARREMPNEANFTARLRDCLLERFQDALPGLRINGSMKDRLPGNLNVAFPGVNADALMMSLPDVAFSTGSACSSASAEPSHVLKALGADPETLRSSVRFGIGRFNTENEVEYAADRVIEAVRKLQSLAV